MNTPNPAARSSFAFSKLSVCALDALASGLDKLGIFYPANPFVTSERCDVVPGFERVSIDRQCLAQVSWHFMNDAVGDSYASHKGIIQRADC